MTPQWAMASSIKNMLYKGNIFEDMGFTYFGPVDGHNIEEMVKVFNGTYDDIYDLDNNKIDMVVDANYPAEVKRAIEGMVSFREDCMYFRDLGLRLKSIEEIKDADKNSLKNKFCASYHNSYDIGHILGQEHSDCKGMAESLRHDQTL